MIKIQEKIHECFIAQWLRRVASTLLAHSEKSFVFRLLQNSAVLRFLGERLPLTAGVCMAALFVMPHAYFNNAISLVVMILLNLLLFLQVLQGQYRSGETGRANPYALVFGLTVVLALVFSGSPQTGLRFSLFYITAFLGFILCRTIIRSRRDFSTVLICLLAAVTISGLYGCYQGVVGVPVQSWQLDAAQRGIIPGRVFSFFDNPNNFAEILILTLPFFIVYFILGRNRYYKLAVCLCALPPAISLALTYSRSGWLAFAAGVMLFFLLTYRYVVPVLCILAVAAMPLLPDSMQIRIISIFTGGDSSIQYRTTIRDTLLPALRENWLMGMGLGSDIVRQTTAGYHALHNPGVYAIAVVHAHNHLLQLWAELGILGVVSFGGVIASFFRDCLRRLHEKTKEQRLFLAAGLASVAGIMVMGLVEYVWFYPRVMLLFWLVITLTTTRLSLKE